MGEIAFGVVCTALAFAAVIFILFMLLAGIDDWLGGALREKIKRMLKE